MKTETHPVDPKIAHPLGKLRGIIRRYVTIEGVLGVGLFLVLWFWLAMLVDFGIFKLFTFDWVLDAPKALRAIALVVVAGFLAVYIVRKLFIRLTRDFSNESLALVLEKRFPKILGDRLISAVQLADLEKAASYGYSVDMIKKTIDDVRDRVDEIPVNQVFAWKRLYQQAALFLFLTFGLSLVAAGATCAITKRTPKQFWNEFTDVSAMLVERDMLLKNTPWPRRAYMEVVAFEDDEQRIGRDVPNPRIRVAAFSFVYADNNKPMGWRPLTWADVPKLLPGETVPALPLQQLRDARFAVDFGPFLYGTAHPFQAPTLPTDVSHVPDEPQAWAVDRVEQVFVQSEEVKALLQAKHADELAAITTILEKLAAKATDPSNSRTVRKLKIPDEVELRYWGLKSSVDMKLRPEANNEFSGVLSDLKESVKFFARGENFDTPTKQFTLVPPPLLTDLNRDEYQPAYLYHKSPFADAKDLANEQKPYFADPMKLKGVKQEFKDKKVTLTGDKSRFDIPAGTELVLTGTADKDLKEVQILPKPGKFPGVEADVTEPTPITLPVVDTRRFSIEFSAKTKRLIEAQTEFEIFLRDTDNVTSKRLVQIVVEEDRPPEVDVVVDVIRKVGGTYICTPQALIPFTRDSKIRDDKGLNRAEFLYSYYMVEPQAITNKRGEYAAWLWNNIPLVPNLGNPIFRAAMLVGNYPLIQATQSTTDSRVPIPGFAEAYTRRSLTLEQIKKLLPAAPAATESLIVKDVDFRSSVDEIEFLDDTDAKAGFDLKKVLVGLKKNTETEVQNNYILNVTVTATDTNVDAPRPGLSQNRETLVFRLVSDGELLAEIAREEATLADKMDDALRRIAEIDNKYRSMTARFGGLTSDDAFTAERTRAIELQELLGRVRDLLGEINADYSRILLEYKANRLDPKLIRTTNDNIVKKLNEIVAKDGFFEQADKAYAQVHNAILTNKQPGAEDAFTAQTKITTLMFKLREIRNSIGAGLDVKKLVGQAEAIIKGLIFTKQYIDDWIKVETGLVKAINVRAPSAVTLKVGAGESDVKIPVIIGPLYSGNLTLKIEPSNDAVFKDLPKTVKLNDDDNSFVLKLKAGMEKGTFTIRITPDVGPIREFKVTIVP